MSSRTLFPPLVNSYEPAFLVGSGSSLKVYFSLNNLSNIPAGTNITVHAQIYRQDGVRVLKTSNDIANKRYRAAGIILNLQPTKAENSDNLYYVTIDNSDLKSQVELNGTTYRGWIPGWVYKVQLRISTQTFDPTVDPKQEVWLQKYASNFSEWSTMCYVKAIAPMIVKIPEFRYDSSSVTNVYDPEIIYNLKSMRVFSGTIESGDSVNSNREIYDYVKIFLYDNITGELVEESPEVHPSEQSNTYFEYQFKTNFVYSHHYLIKMIYKTENEYVSPKPLEFQFQLIEEAMDPIDLRLVSVDHDVNNVFKDISCLDLEEDEGRVALKLYSSSGEIFSGNVCIRRSSQEDNFTTWEDIQYLTIKQQDVNELPPIYDYTIKSGVWYKYGIQNISKLGERGKLEVMSNPIQRLFNFTFLLGKGGRQLKIPYNTTIGNFRYQLYDSKTDTIGSKYPFITRNASVNYRTFSLSTLISFLADDEQHTFLRQGKEDLYKYAPIIQLYDDYVIDNKRYYRDYTYERDFREKVLEFLQDGKPKLFKSPSEGNIIVRLTEVTCVPNASLGNMVYSVSMNADEIDDSTMQNYLKYGFYYPGTYSTDLSVYNYQIGQIDGKFTDIDNVFKMIYEKYDSQGKNYGGYARKLRSISRVRITINGYYSKGSTGEEQFIPGHQLRVYNNNRELVLGNNFQIKYSGLPKPTIITIYDPRGIYEFDSLLSFHYNEKELENDSLYLLTDAEGVVTGVDATIDFIYELSVEEYEEHQIEERRPIKGIGQFYGEVEPGDSIYKTIYYQHYLESDSIFKYLNNITSIEIEANPHTVFAIRDRQEKQPQIHEINETGVLRLYELEEILEIKYLGKRYLETPYDESTLTSEVLTESVLDKDNHFIINAAADVSVTYRYMDIQGTYKEAT